MKILLLLIAINNFASDSAICENPQLEICPQKIENNDFMGILSNWKAEFRSHKITDQNSDALTILSILLMGSDLEDVEYVFICDKLGNLRSFGIYSVEEDKERLYLEYLLSSPYNRYTSPQGTLKGAGKKVITELFKVAREKKLNISLSPSYSSKNFYLRIGFRIDKPNKMKIDLEQIKYYLLGQGIQEVLP